MNMSKSDKYLMEAYERGYRAVDGRIVSPNGEDVVVFLTGAKDNKWRYPCFTFYPAKGDYKYPIKAHRFAAYCYFGKVALEAESVRHLNGNTADFSQNNIAYGTHKENTADIPREKFLHGTQAARKTRHLRRPPAAKLTDDEVRYIRQSEKSRVELAEMFGIHRDSVGRVINRKVYSHVK